MRLAFLFPGQGSQEVGMGRDLAQAFPVAREAFETADRVLAFPLSRICWEGPEEELRRTENAQPALLTHGVAALRALQQQSPASRPAWTAGHSLGEYTACVAAGALEFEEALRLVRRRGELMRDADPEGRGTMLAVLGVDAEAARRICERARAAGVIVPANLNAPGQVVLSGDRAAVEAASEIAPSLGAKRCVRLEVSGAFHSPLMAAAREELAAVLDHAAFREPACPVVTNADAVPASSVAAIRDALRRQLTGTVRWEESMRALLAAGAEGFVEIGPGRVLRGLLRSIERAARSWSVGDPESLGAALGELRAPGVSAEASRP